MKRLFKDQDTVWKEEANDLTRDVRQAIRPIIDAWVSKGYSIREIGYIVVMEATGLTVEIALTKRLSGRKKKSPRGFKV